MTSKTFRSRFCAVKILSLAALIGLTLSISTILGGLFPQTASAATLFPTTLQELTTAISNATPGDTIDLSAAPDATIATNGLKIDKDLTIANGTLKVLSNFRHINITAPLTLTLDNVTLKGNNSGGVFTAAGGGIIIDPTVTGGQTLITGNGLITDCYIVGFGSIMNNSTTNELTVDGINIINNLASNSGGGIASFGPLNLVNATIDSNAANVAGGGIYVNNSTFTMTGGTITNNASPRQGGGGVATGGSTVTITGGTIANNSAMFGGGVYTINGDTELSGDIIISGNSTTNFGGGVYIDRELTVAGNAKITGNSTQTSGGGIYSERTTSAVTIDDNALIDDNHADANGAGIRATGALTINGGTIISNNDALGLGGGVFMSGAGRIFAVANGATITNNEAGQNGGGIYMNSGTLSMGGTVTHNTAVGDTSPRLNGAGGGIFLSTNTIATISSTGIVTNNTAVNGRGGAVYLQTFPQLTTELGATFSGNTAFYAVPWQIADNDMSMQSIIATYNTYIHSNTMSTLAGSDNIYDGYDVNYAPLISNEPIIDEPVTEGDRIITGTADTPGSVVTVYFRDGDGDPTNNPRVTTTVRADGTWEVAVPGEVNLETGTVIEATQKSGSLQESTADDAVVRTVEIELVTPDDSQNDSPDAPATGFNTAITKGNANPTPNIIATIIVITTTSLLIITAQKTKKSRGGRDGI